MKLTSTYLLILLCLSCVIMSAQNLLDTSTWTVGSGSVSGYSQYGVTSENSREFGTDPFSNSSILWKASPNSGGTQSGGFGSSYKDIDHTETYRLSVWIKKTNSNNGHTFFKLTSYIGGEHHTLKLNGTVQAWPQFWYGDLPQLNKWYLLVGYIHGSNYNSNLSYGGIYDPTTGTKVVNMADYKFKNTATKLQHRAFLYGGTNTSDRQYMFAPRMEMVDGNEPPIADLLGLNEVDPNLLAPINWTVGSGSISGYSQYGETEENSRVYHDNHIGNEVVIWQATPNSGGNGSGGFTSPVININPSKMYRMSVWIKKTGSNDGTTHFKPYSYTSGSHQTIYLNGGALTWQPFWYGDLPKLNRWYLLVGYVHSRNDNSTVDLGKIYDGTTGEAVLNMRDHKFKSFATVLRNQAILWANTTLSDRQYAYAPRIEEVNGQQWSLDQLLSINPESKLIFSYDVAGNQTQRFYCEEEGFCSPSATSSRRIDEKGVTVGEEQGVLVAEQTGVPLPEEEVEEEKEGLDVNYSIYPNPTDNKVTIQLSGKDYNLTNSISIYNTNGSLIRRIEINDPTNQMNLDLSNDPSGVYFLHLHFTNGTTTTEQIIKN